MVTYTVRIAGKPDDTRRYHGFTEYNPSNNPQHIIVASVEGESEVWENDGSDNAYAELIRYYTDNQDSNWVVQNVRLKTYREV